MSRIRYGNVSALTEYMIEGNKFQEWIAYFIWCPEFTDHKGSKKKGFIVKKTPITMAKIIRRLNKNLKCETQKSSYKRNYYE